GNWFGDKNDGIVTVECTAYKGGVIVKKARYHFKQRKGETAILLLAVPRESLRVLEECGRVKGKRT
ncbi:hypothetical protein, partial [Anaerotruncus colihominis]|uniref:hypothetical protein n=1 Tax=Anaerotruncus colihominis TaxID=169435 RepID=UPI003AB580D0